MIIKNTTKYYLPLIGVNLASSWVQSSTLPLSYSDIACKCESFKVLIKASSIHPSLIIQVQKSQLVHQVSLKILLTNTCQKSSAVECQRNPDLIPLEGNIYHPQMKLGQGNIFTNICHSFHRWGWLPSMYHRSNDQGNLHPEGYTWDTTGYGQQGGSMHPTGIHSCCCLFLPKMAFFICEKLLQVGHG